MKIKIVLLFIGVLLLASCSPQPKAIEYGIDGCRFCKMTIVDKVHAAEVVTDKGKVYKFDAAECMVNFMNEFETSTIALYLVNDFKQPEVLINATTATYLISKNIPSPMGAFLSAFNNKDDALSTQKEHGGDVYSWKELLEHLKATNVSNN